jgi:glycosyl transferase family 87
MQEQFFHDWQSMMAGIRYWLAGGNPYGQFPNFRGQLMHAGEFAYPPPALLLGAPLAFLPWLWSGLLMLLISVVGFEYWTRRTSRRIGLMWLILWLPFCQGLWLGQITLLAMVGLVLAEQAYAERSDSWAGVLLALALIKPQVAALPVAWLLIVAFRAGRSQLLIAFAVISAALWGGITLISGPMIYQAWLIGLMHYGPGLPLRSLAYPPLGFILILLAGLLWWRVGRRDIWGGLLLFNTLLFPFTIAYATIGIAFAVIRWRPDWRWYPLVLSWCIPALVTIPRTPSGLTMITQAVAMPGLLAGLCPSLPWWRWLPQELSIHEDPS